MLYWTPESCALAPEAIDFILTLGGDGTVLYTSWLFQKGQVPPIIPFHLGSLGFLTPFDFKDIRKVLQRVVGCDSSSSLASQGVRVNMRMRFKCTVWRSRGINVAAGGSSTLSSLLAGPDIRKASQQPHSEVESLLPSFVSTARHARTAASAEVEGRPSSTGPAQPVAVGHHKPVPTESFMILNDLVVDRGPSPYISQLELYGDDRHLTTVQADGLVVATPTGSTAYSLSAGGSMVHPEVPAILVTPICARGYSKLPAGTIRHLTSDQLSRHVVFPTNATTGCHGTSNSGPSGFSKYGLLLF